MFGNLGAKRASRRGLEATLEQLKDQNEAPRGGGYHLARHQPSEPGPWGGVGEGFPLPRIGDWRDINTCVRSTRQRPKGLGGFPYQLVNLRINALLNPTTYLGYTGCWIQPVTAPTLVLNC